MSDMMRILLQWQYLHPWIDLHICWSYRKLSCSAQLTARPQLAVSIHLLLLLLPVPLRSRRNGRSRICPAAVGPPFAGGVAQARLG